VTQQRIAAVAFATLAGQEFFGTAECIVFFVGGRHGVERLCPPVAERSITMETHVIGRGDA